MRGSYSTRYFGHGQSQGPITVLQLTSSAWMRLEVKTGAYSTFTWIVHNSTANNDSVRLSLCPKISNNQRP